jgi:Conjugative transposon protein TcpC
MVRRSTVDRGPQPDLYGAGYGTEAGDYPQGGTGKRPRSGQGWRGAGGRWLVWTFRVVVWAVLLIIGYRGVTAIVLNETPPSHTPPARVAQAPGFPVELAGAYALQFGQAYLNASPATASQRATALAQFLPPGAPDPQLGLNGGGTLSLQSEQVAGVKVTDAQHAVVTLLARVNGTMMELGVPVYATAGGMVISGEPAWLPAPKPVGAPAAPTVNSDSATESELTRQLLPAFFTAYASGDQATLGRFLVAGTSLTGLGGSVVFGSVTSVTAPVGGPVRHIVATVAWEIPGQAVKGARAGNTTASLEMTYALTIVRQHGTWYVQNIAPSTQAGGQP